MDLALSVFGVLAGATVLVLIGWTVRKWLKSDEDDAPTAGGLGFTLSDLRAMHKSGQMSDEEYERARAQMVARIQAASERKSQVAKGEASPLVRRQRADRSPDRPGSSNSDQSP